MDTETDVGRAADERWFLVSGGSGGIGSAVCEQLAARGYTPIVGYHRNAAAAESLAQRTGGVRAGSPPLSPVPFGKITADEMRQQWQVNVMGPQRLLAELVRRCFRRHKQGSVVGVLTQAMGDGAAGAASGMGAYVIAKHGMAGMLALLAADHPWLRVRSVKPGYTETRMLAAFDERFLAMQREKAAFQTPEQVASLILEEAIGP